MATLRRKRSTGIYYVDYAVRDESGCRARKRESLNTADPDVAARLFNAVAARIEAGRVGQKAGPERDPTLTWLVDWYVDTLMVARGNKPVSREATRVQGRHFADWMAARGVVRVSQLAATPYRLDEYARDLLVAHQPYTVRTALVRVRAVFRGALSRKLIPAMPVEDWPIPPKPQPTFRDDLKLEHIQGMLAAMRESGSPNYRPVLLLAYLGCRPSDICLLEWDRVDLERGLIAIRQKKTGDPVWAPMAAPVRRVLQEQKLATGQGRLVFVNEDGNPLQRNCLANAMIAFSAERGLPKLTPKVCRQLVVTDLIEAGVDRAIIGAITGHKSDAMERYIRLRSGAVRRAAEGFAERNPLEQAPATGTPRRRKA